MATIRTNNIPRDTLRFDDLTKHEQQSVIDECGAQAVDDWSGFRFKGMLYSLEEFAIVKHMPRWDAAAAQSAFHGVLVRLVDNGEKVVVGEMFS